MCTYPKEFKKHIEEIVACWKPRLLLHCYSISFKYQTKKKGDADASIIVDDCYLQGIINIFPSLLDDWTCKNYKDVENTLVHELVHIITNGFSNIAEKYTPELFHGNLEHENEKLVQTIANILIYNKEKDTISK